MGAPVVRRDELDAEIDKLRKEAKRAAAAGRKKASDPDQAFVTREQLRAEFVEFAKMLGLAPAPAEDLDPVTTDVEQLADAEPVELAAAEADAEHGALFETEGEDS